MACAASAEGWETNSVFLLSGKHLPQQTAGKEHNVNKSSQTKSLSLRYAKNANPRRKSGHSSTRAAAASGAEAADGQTRNCGTAAVLVSTEAAVCKEGEGAHTLVRRVQDHKTADFVFFKCTHRRHQQRQQQQHSSYATCTKKKT